MRCVTWIVLAVVCAAGAPAWGQTPAEFYRGQTIKLHVSTSPGGGYDLVSRMFAKYFPAHMPGRPNVIVVNMPGAAGVSMTNWAYNVAPKDGTIIGMPNLTVPMNQVIILDQVRYDATKLNWIGNLE